MLSRVAESVYWMSRYVERAENTARFIDAVRHLVLDLPDSAGNQWESLVNTSGDEEDYRERYGEATQHDVTHFMTFDTENPNSMLSCLWSARENARSVREAISSEMWEQINRSYLMLKEAQASDRLEDDPAAFYSHFKKACHLFMGITDATMTHGEGWHFGRFGRLIERADKTSRVIDVKYFVLLPRADYVGSPYDSLQWAALLKSISAFEMYRKRFHRIAPASVAEFLILDREFPRSMHYCLIKSEESLHAIAGSPAGTYCNTAEQLVGRLCSELDYAGIEQVQQAGLHEYLDGFQASLNDIGLAVHDTFFAAAPVAGVTGPDDTKAETAA